MGILYSQQVLHVLAYADLDRRHVYSPVYTAPVNYSYRNHMANVGLNDQKRHIPGNWDMGCIRGGSYLSAVMALPV